MPQGYCVRLGLNSRTPRAGRPTTGRYTNPKGQRAVAVVSRPHPGAGRAQDGPDRRPRPQAADRVVADGDDRRGPARRGPTAGRGLTDRRTSNPTFDFSARPHSRGWLLSTIRGGGDPSQNMATAPFVRMGPPPRSPAAEAHGCFMVRTPSGSNRIQGRGARFARAGGLPSVRCSAARPGDQPPRR